jgi:formylglycine-generating enzyme
MEGRRDLNQALQKHLLWLLSHQPKTFPGLMRGKELTSTIMLEAFGKCALGPIEFHAPASCVELTLYVPIIEPPHIKIAAGWFFMGSNSGQDVETPVHRVWVDSFAMAVTQVTVADYARFLDAGGSIPPPFWDDANFSHPLQPVVAVSWFDAVAYCEWLSTTTGSLYRLPTEAEWERAARGGTEGTMFPWGDEPPVSRPGYHTQWKNGPEQVGQSEPNAYGLFEMCENVHEWCSDWFQADYYRSSPDRNPQGPETGTRRASRGGSWRHQIKISRCSARSSIPPEFKYADYGFRVVR